MEYKYLKSSIKPEDLKTLTNEQKLVLCEELRDKILNVVSSNGGHLASNLGDVELCVALLTVFDFKKDRVVFDVGHQAYAYKLLTGRFDEFDTLRQKGGISGFPRRSESIYDSFDTGHSSTSVSAALGMKRGEDISGQDDGYVIAVIGDGALTGGLAYEALNDLGHSSKKLIVILNDNEMSIDKNVGGLAKHLSKIRVSKGYLSAKKNTEYFLNTHFPILGKPVVKAIVGIKDFLRFVLYHKKSPIFENLGLNYYGPVNGNNLAELTESIIAIKDIPDPVLLHITTKKGLGYKFAEEMPSNYHGVGSFDLKEGAKEDVSKSYTHLFGSLMCEFALKNPNVAAVCAAMSKGTGLERFASEYPERFFDTGIAEAHAVTMAAGMSVEGVVPVVAVYSTFLQRGYDEIIHDVCFMNNHVVFCLDRAGFIGADGHTHMGIYDLSYMNAMPNMTVFSPFTKNEFISVMKYSIETAEGPCTIRYPKGNVTDTEYEDISLFEPKCIADSGYDYVLVTFGRLTENCTKAHDILLNQGIRGKVIHILCVKPLNTDSLIKMIGNIENVFMAEEGILTGGIGSTFGIELHRHGYRGNYDIFAVENGIIRAATVNEQLADNRLDAESIAERIKTLLDNNKQYSSRAQMFVRKI